MLIQAPKGTKDILPKDSYIWQFIESIIRQEAELYGYREIRTPVFEHTELFARGVGDTTDIVQKEMYTFQDKGGRSITLKPEGTAGTVRAILESRLYTEILPCKVYYLNCPVFRYENPQHGRLREHHQLGFECFGIAGPSADAELILFLLQLLKRLGLKGLSVSLNSIGCPKCRPVYNQALKTFLGDHLQELCPQCQERFQKNPLRILDCKEDSCKLILKDAPSILDTLCDECDDHFVKLQDLLKLSGVEARIDPRIVRGLDYYTKTVFEIMIKADRGDIALCGGGRYDGLVEQLGGPPTPGVGFGLGLERLIMELNKQAVHIPEPNLVDVFVAYIGQNAKNAAFLLTQNLRVNGIKADCEQMDRGLKAQMRYANKINCPIVALLGDDELAKGSVRLKMMREREEKDIPIEDALDTIKQNIER